VPKLTVFAQALSDHFAHGISAPRYVHDFPLRLLLSRPSTLAWPVFHAKGFAYGAGLSDPTPRWF